MNFSDNLSIQQLNSANAYLHQSIQIIAVTNTYLLEEKENNSQLNVTWHANTNTLYGDLINSRARVAIHLPSFSLKVIGPTGIELIVYNLAGKNLDDAIDWMKMALQLKQIDTDSVKLELPYPLPDLNTSKVFPSIDPKVLQELANHRSIAENILSSIYMLFPDAKAPRTWPRDFDHSIQIPFQPKEDSKTVYCKVGYSIADENVNEPYFFTRLNHNSQLVNFENAPSLSNGNWESNSFNGSVLALSDILAMKNPEEGIFEFLISSIDFLKSGV